MSHRKILTNILASFLTNLVETIQHAETSDRVALNAKADRVVCILLNCLYGWNLKNLHYGKQYHPAIDLGDMERGIAVHVDSSKKLTRQKFQHTLDLYQYHGLHHTYNQLIIVTLSPPRVINWYDCIPDAFPFDLHHDIWTPETIIHALDSAHPQALHDAVTLLHPEFRSSVTYPLPLPPMPCQSFVSVSRDTELCNLDQKLTPGKKFILWGPAGIGKTELACYYAWTHYWEKEIYFLRYQPDGGMRATILGAPFNGFLFENEDTPEQEKEYQARLAILREKYRDAVVIIDGFDCPGKSANELMKETAFRDLESAGVTMIITTRSKVKGSEIEVHPLTEAHALLLMHYCFFEKQYEVSRLLPMIRGVEGHPLTVKLLAQTLQQSEELTPEIMLNALETGTLHSLPLPLIEPDEENSQPAGTMIEILQQQIASSFTDEQGWNVLCGAALISRNGMDAQYFRNCLPKDLWKDLQYLTSQNLLAQSKQSLSIPAWVRLACRANTAAMHQYCPAFLECLWGSFDPARYDPPLVSQLASCFAAAVPFHFPNDMDHALRAAKLREMDGDLQLALAMAHTACEYATQKLPTDHEAVAGIFLLLGRLHSALSQHEEALKFRLKLMDMLKKISPPNSPDLASAYFDLGQSYEALEDHISALDCYLKAVNIRKLILSEDHPDLALSVKQAEETFRRVNNNKTS